MTKAACFLLFLLASATDVANGKAPFFDVGENLSFPNCGMWHRHESHSPWLAYMRHEGEECYGIVISHKTILTHKPDECRIRVREVGRVVAYLGECASATAHDKPECVGKHVQIKDVVAINQNPAKAGEDGVYVRIYRTEKMPADVTPICLFNRDRQTDFTQTEGTRYFALNRFKGRNNGDWIDQIEPRNLVPPDECFRNQNYDKEELDKLDLPPPSFLCVHAPHVNGRFLVNFHNGRYFLRGFRVIDSLFAPNTSIYRDILLYIKPIGVHAEDVAIFPSTPREKPAREFSNAHGLSFKECGTKLQARAKRDGDFVATKFVIGGFQARQDAHPWHAAIENAANGSFCGGTLISDTVVLTAAHCIYDMRANDFRVTIGMYDWSSADNDTRIQIRTPSRLIPHPSYTSEQFHYDVGLMIFDESFQINDHVRPVCLWSEGSSLDLVAGKPAVLVGYGLAENYSVPDTLQEAQLPIRNHTDCYLSNRLLFGKRLKPGDNFCAGTRNGVSACVGDSGGSLTLQRGSRWFIRGLVSFGMSKVIRVAGKKQIVCNPRSYSLYADVAHYMDWIVQNTPGIFFKS